jgi:hypothetical protein
MKNFKKISSRFSYVLLAAIVFFGCEEPSKQKENVISAKKIDIHWIDENGYSDEENFTVVTIDSCEYLLAVYDRSRMITHKGNCKFCAERKIKTCQ